MTALLKLAMRLGVVAFASLPLAVAAQQGRVLEEVVVTAQKTQQSLQDVPISISAMSGEFMQDNAVTDLVEVSAYVPNVRVEFTSPSSPQVFVRGFGTNAFNPSFEPAVGFVQDEIFFGRPTYFTESMFDLERVEILRGPQGTLFGKNTVAGVFSVTTRGVPDDGWAADLSYKQESYGDKRIDLAGGYRFSPTFGIRAAVLKSDRDGRMDNTKANRKEDNRDQDAWRFKAEWDPMENLALQFVAQSSETTLNFWPRQLMNMDADTRDYLDNFDPAIEDDPYNFQTSFDNPGEMFKGSDTALIRGDWGHGAVFGFDDVTSTFVLGSSILDVTQFQDLDVSPADLLNLDEVDDYEQYSFEWRFAANAGSLFGLGGNVSALAGVYWFQSDFHIIADVIIGQDIGTYATTTDGMALLGGGSPSGNPFGGTLGSVNPVTVGMVNETDFYRFDYFQDTEALALFGQVVWDLTDRLVLTPGVRINRETKKSTPTGTSYCTNKSPISPCITPTAMGANDYAPGTIERTERNVSPKVSLAYYITEAISVYGAWSRGFKSGGVNAISFTGEGLEFEPEEAESWEIGFRSQLFDDTLKLNATAYRMDFEDLQVLAFNGLFFDVTNAAEAYSEGLEADIQWLSPWAPFSLDASIGYLKARYKKYPAAPAPVSEGLGELQDLAGKPLGFAPRWAATVTPRLEFPVGSMLLKIGVSAVYQGEHFTDTDLDPNTRIPGTTELNAHISLKSEEQGWHLTIGGKNIEDKRTLNQVIDTALFPGTYNPSQRPGRSVYATLGYRL